MRKPCQSPGRMKNSSYYIAPVGDRTHDLPHTVASNMVKVSLALNHVNCNMTQSITFEKPARAIKRSLKYDNFKVGSYLLN